MTGMRRTTSVRRRSTLLSRTCRRRCRLRDRKSVVAGDSFDCTFPDGPATSTVSVTANDGDASNNIGSASVDVAIANVPPTVSFTAAPATASEGQTKTYSYTVTDAGNDPSPTI